MILQHRATFLALTTLTLCAWLDPVSKFFYGAGQVIRSGLGSIPLVKDKEDKEEDAEDTDMPAAPMPASNRPTVLPDGSYATQVGLGHAASDAAVLIDGASFHLISSTAKNLNTDMQW